MSIKTSRTDIDLAHLSSLVGSPLCSAADEHTTEIWSQDDVATDDQIQAALDSYVEPTSVDVDLDFRKAVESSTTLSELKAALIGHAGPGAAARRGESARMRNNIDR